LASDHPIPSRLNRIKGALHLAFSANLGAARRRRKNQSASEMDQAGADAPCRESAKRVLELAAAGGHNRLNIAQ
jgi:predicted ATPase with chaperone activity